MWNGVDSPFPGTVKMWSHCEPGGEIVGTPNTGGAESNSGRGNNKYYLKQLSIAPTVKLK